MTKSEVPPEDYYGPTIPLFDPVTHARIKAEFDAAIAEVEAITKAQDE